MARTKQTERKRPASGTDDNPADRPDTADGGITAGPELKQLTKPIGVSVRKGPGGQAPCPDCQKMFSEPCGVNRHRIIQHGRRLNGTKATPEEIEQVRGYGRHQPRVVVRSPAHTVVSGTDTGPVEIPVTKVSRINERLAASIGAGECSTVTVDELTLAVESISPPVDEVSTIDAPNAPASPIQFPEAGQHTAPGQEIAAGKITELPKKRGLKRSKERKLLR